jgi:lipopolysaccharide/colanic/teichoic acid biosynthesis glycosyltransferase
MASQTSKSTGTKANDLTSRSSLRAWRNKVVKRAFDILASAPGLFLLSPFLGIIAWAIKSDSPGPVFYRGRRAGQHGKEFDILKFRSMYERPESYQGEKITTQDDPRITPVGKWLRKAKLNELPQLWNVLKGEMSLVGPRPEDPEIVATWPEELRKEILSVRPGITSPASVMFRDEEQQLGNGAVMDKYLGEILPSKLRLDQIYVRNRSFMVDLDIIFMTLVSLLPNLRGEAIPEHLLLWGPLSRLFSRHLSRFVIDIPIAFLAVGVSGLFWRISGPLNLGVGRALLLALGIALLFGVVNALLGLNRMDWSRAPSGNVLLLAASSGIATIIPLLVDRVWSVLFTLPLGLWAMTGILAFFGFTVARYRLRLLTGLASRWLRLRGEATRVGERVLIVGAGEGGFITTWLLGRREFASAFTIVGIVDDDPRKIGLRVDGLEVLGSTRDIPSLVKQRDIKLVLFAIGEITPKRRKAILDLCHQAGVRVVMVPDLLGFMRASLQASAGESVASSGWNGAVPASVVLSWLTEVERLARPEDRALLDYLARLRAELTK